MSEKNQFGVESNNSGGFGGRDFEDFGSMLDDANDAAQLDESEMDMPFGFEEGPQRAKVALEVTQQEEMPVAEAVGIEFDEDFASSPDEFDFESEAQDPNETDDSFVGFSDDFSNSFAAEAEAQPQPISNLAEEESDTIGQMFESAPRKPSPRRAAPIVEETIDAELKNSDLIDAVINEQIAASQPPAPINPPQKTQLTESIKRQPPRATEADEKPVQPTAVIETSIIESSPQEESINPPMNELTLENVSKVIKTIDAIRKLNDDSAVKMANIYITNGSPVNGEYELVLAAIRCDRQLMKTTTSLIEGKAQDKVDRAFSILALDDKTFVSLGDLVKSSGEVGLPEDFTFTGDRLKYARALVDAIDNMSDESVNYVGATQIILSASE